MHEFFDDLATEAGIHFSRGSRASWHACFYCILLNEHLGRKTSDLRFCELCEASPNDENAIRVFFPEAVRIFRSHSLPYFVEEYRSLRLQVFDALSLTTDETEDSGPEEDNLRLTVPFFESLPWDNPWRDSNRVMFRLADLCLRREHSGMAGVESEMTSALDWLDKNQCPRTGLWKDNGKFGLLNCMAATFHFSFFYFWVGREMRYPERIIDSCLSLQEDHGLFSGPYQVGHTCLDYDAIDLLAKCTLLTSHRRSEIEDALARAKQSLFLLQNSDGGYANCKIQRGIRFDIPGTREFQRRMVLTFRHPAVRSVFLKQHPATGDYSVCLDYLRCKNAESNIFSTWFRTLAINLCDTILDPERVRRDGVRFRRLPFLGYHPFE